MSNEIIRISNIAKEHQKIDTVMYAINKANLKESAKKMKANKATGIDQVTKQEYMANIDENIENLIIRMKRMSVYKMLYKTLNRRNQKKSYNKTEFYEKIGKKIEKPRIYVDIVKMAYAM